MKTEKQITKKVEADKPAVKEGKIDITKKHREMGFMPLSEEDGPQMKSMLDLHPDLQKEFDKYDLVPRWLNRKEFGKRGMHLSGWVPYKSEWRPASTVGYNVGPDGCVVFGDLILGAKPKEHQKAHIKRLRERAERISNPQALATQNLKDSARQAGLKTVIKEGFED